MSSPIPTLTVTIQLFVVTVLSNEELFLSNMRDLQKVSALFVLQLYFTGDNKNKIIFLHNHPAFSTFFTAFNQLFNAITIESI